MRKTRPAQNVDRQALAQKAQNFSNNRGNQITQNRQLSNRVSQHLQQSHQILTIGLIRISSIATISIGIMWEEEPTCGGPLPGPRFPIGEPGTGQRPTTMMKEYMLIPSLLPNPLMLIPTARHDTLSTSTDAAYAERSNPCINKWGLASAWRLCRRKQC